MKYRFTIGRKIGLGFGIILLLFIVASYITNHILIQSKERTERVTKIFNPSVAALKEFDNLLNRANLLITKWYYIQSDDDKKEKGDLRILVNISYPTLREKILTLSVNWSKAERKNINEIIGRTDQMFKSYKEDIMDRLNSFTSYVDPNIKFESLLPLEDNETIYISSRAMLSEIIELQNAKALENSNGMLASFNFLQNLVIWIGAIVLFGGILISIFTVRSIVKPVQQLKTILLMMGKGIHPTERITTRNDEIGEMSIALNALIEAMARTTEFANEVGAGNFISQYTPLSNEDTLGEALLKMRDDLRENERVLEAKVIERTEEVVRQKEEIETKNEELEVLYKHVTDSIRYAKRIQEAILPPTKLMDKLLPDSFVLYKPKDIVSGDFYWLDSKANKTMFAAVDCTGHGVPGAFMSIVGYNILKYIVSNTDFDTPASILDALNIGVSETLHHGQDASQTKDGMDLAFCTIDFNTLELQYAGAYNPLYIIRKGELLETKADKFPIGLFLGEEKKKFTNHTLQLQKGDMLYIFSDGYADQFGGPKGKKFMANNFRKMLIDIHPLPVDKQREELNTTIEAWRGNLDQVDDILIMGVQF